MKTINFLISTTLLVFTLTTISLMAQDISVVDVKRNITLSDSDLVYKDYYLNAGDASSLRKNMVVNVKRKINIKDSGTKSVGDFETVVGQLKIIHIGNKVTVAREHKLIPRDEEPMLEQIGIMSGDRLDLAGSFIDNTKPNFKHKTSDTEAPVKPNDIKTVDAGNVINPQTPISTEDQNSVREPANQLNNSPSTQHPIAIPQI